MSVDAVDVSSLKHLTSPQFGNWPSSLAKGVQDAVRPHIESFNYAMTVGLDEICPHLYPINTRLPASGDILTVKITSITVGKPKISFGKGQACRTHAIYPAECRITRQTYKAPVDVNLQWSIRNSVVGSMEHRIGEIPVMVRSNCCNLDGLSPADLARVGEEGDEVGGYFITNGVERAIRMLIAPRRNIPQCLIRSSFKSRGPLYTDFGIQIRCIGPDQAVVLNFVHFLNNGNVVVGLFLGREQFFVPAILLMKALYECPDVYIFERMVHGCETNAYFRGLVVAMLRRAQDANLLDRVSVLRYIGKTFRVRLSRVPEWYSDEEAGQYVLNHCLLTHLSEGIDKFNLLAYMIQRVCLLAKGECAPDNPDSLSNHEVLTSGQVYLQILKEGLEKWMFALGLQLKRVIEPRQEDTPSTKRRSVAGTGKSDIIINDIFFREHVRCIRPLTHYVQYVISTGNVPSNSSIVGLQSVGLVVAADSINRLRFMSHFAAVHRGAFFTEMRSSTVRQLRPESFGFICSVHTPDGAPCGLLNHLAQTCKVLAKPGNHSEVVQACLRLGVAPWQSVSPKNEHPVGYYTYPVFVDGCLVGYVLSASESESVVNALRALKLQKKISEFTEICYIPLREAPTGNIGLAAPSPGIFIFTTACRLMRPVINTTHNAIEYIGTLEQVWTLIALPVQGSDIVSSELPNSQHMELTADCQLSVMGAFAPFPDFNQSPRNVYQCQMSKQAIGWGYQSPYSRADLKSYSMVCPQAPFCRTRAYVENDGDSHPIGTSAVVAVVSYTGYDMEDAMVTNKASCDRGLARANIYYSSAVNLREVDDEKDGPVSYCFGKDPKNSDLAHLDDDGLPAIGTRLEPGGILCCYRHVHKQNLYGTKKFKGSDPVVVERVALLQDDAPTPAEWAVRATILLRQPRPPAIGDKFASRHGQKGICSAFWPEADLPFTEQGITADIIFNPHGFPSRMTVGMLLESMAGKAAAAHAFGAVDSSPFIYPAAKLSRSKHGKHKNQEDDGTPADAVDYFGRLLAAAGYNYYGTETMISGVSGEEFEAKIFTGIIYYMRLRHMVADKFQCRSVGPYDPCTQQPIKGRKRGGGTRLGEMERDALLADGAVFLLHDRLLVCSDRTRAVLCRRCQSIITPRQDAAGGNDSGESGRFWTCQMCKRHDELSVVSIAHAFRYLIWELASMNIHVKIGASDNVTM